MCGVVGVVGKSPINQVIYDALILLQHRGQDAAGIMTSETDGRVFLKKSLGLVRDIFQQRHMERLPGNAGIGHLRYPTAGEPSTAEAQPFYVNSPFGIALGHNGNLVNAEDLKASLFKSDLRHINTSSDSEILLNILAHEMQRYCQPTLSHEDIFYAVGGVHRRIQGGYAVVSMVAGRGILGFRDTHGIRPLCYGERITDDGKEYMIASESVALEGCGFTFVRDIEPGEAIYITFEGEVFTRQCAENTKHQPCIFEYVYFARPDSMIDGISVHRARMRMGEKLAQKILNEWPDHDIDVVIPIPDTSRTSALELANHLGVKYREGFIKNRYIGRTFIMPGQKERKKSVRQKLNAISLEFRDKNVLLVDDSIVRGTTSQQIIQMAKEAGARKVYMASAAPPVRHPNVYGIDMPAPEEFVAHNRSVDEIAAEINTDRLIYQDLNDLIAAVKHDSSSISDFDCSCFNGEYISGDISEKYLNDLQERRNDKAKQQVFDSKYTNVTPA